MKQIVCRWMLNNLTEHQKAERVRVGKQTLKLLNNNGGHDIICKTHIPVLMF